ncbi:MAG: ABC transporter permease, partial [Methanosarcinales archaeon]
MFQRPLRIISIAAAVIAWEGASKLINNEIILPSLTSVIQTFYETLISGELIVDLGESLLHFGIGIFFGIIIAIPIGMAMGWNR